VLHEDIDQINHCFKREEGMRELDRPGKRCYYASGKRDFALPKKVTHAPQETQKRFLSAIALRFVIGQRCSMSHLSPIDQPQLDLPFGIERNK
jgi:hypothetical protein